MANYLEYLGLGVVDDGIDLVGNLTCHCFLSLETRLSFAFIGGELDVVAEGLFGFVSADVHHLEDGEFR